MVRTKTQTATNHKKLRINYLALKKMKYRIHQLHTHYNIKNHISEEESVSKPARSVVTLNRERLYKIPD